MSNRDEVEFDLSGWGRLVLGIVGVLMGLAMIGAGVQFGGWWVNGAEETVSTVSCDYDDTDGYDDEDEDDFYYPDDGRVVVHFQDESGVWCSRTTRHDQTFLAADWPLWLAAPGWVVATVLLVCLGVGGLALAFYTVIVVCDRVIRKQFLDWWVRVLADRKR